jgi:hypothetical protein
MLRQFTIKYGDGREEVKLVKSRYVNGILQNPEDATVYPQRDNIVFCHHQSFKYKVPKHAYLPVAIVRFANKTVIMPAGIECHPETEFDDIQVISPQKQEEPKPREQKTWKFPSKSSDGIYTVRIEPYGIRCNCPGVWRAKNKKCKHILEVEQLINK